MHTHPQILLHASQDMQPKCYVSSSLFSGADYYMADENQSYEYELMGVTVHTGTADGGHYYSFICTDMDKQGGEAPETWWVLPNKLKIIQAVKCDHFQNVDGGNTWQVLF